VVPGYTISNLRRSVYVAYKFESNWIQLKQGKWTMSDAKLSNNPHLHVFLACYSSRNQIACFKVRAKSYNVATRTAEPGRVKTFQNSQRSKASNAVLLSWSRAVRKPFRGLEACNLVTTTVVASMILT
jgi:hypothetical protein